VRPRPSQLLALVGKNIGTEAAAFGPQTLQSDGGSGDVGYCGSNGCEPQKFAANNQPCGFICYGFGQWDGQQSGGYFANHCDGGRSHTYCDYRQQ
jgi:hypothetical protein